MFYYASVISNGSLCILVLVSLHPTSVLSLVCEHSLLFWVFMWGQISFNKKLKWDLPQCSYNPQLPSTVVCETCSKHSNQCKYCMVLRQIIIRPENLFMSWTCVQEIWGFISHPRAISLKDQWRWVAKCVWLTFLMELAMHSNNNSDKHYHHYLIIINQHTHMHGWIRKTARRVTNTTNQMTTGIGLVAWTILPLNVLLQNCIYP